MPTQTQFPFGPSDESETPESAKEPQPEVVESVVEAQSSEIEVIPSESLPAEIEAVSADVPVSEDPVSVDAHSSEILDISSEDQPSLEIPAVDDAGTGELPTDNEMPAVLAAPLPRRRRSLWSKLVGAVLKPWVSVKVEPEDVRERLAQIEPGRIVYVIEDYGSSNARILEMATEEAGLPDPMQSLPGDPLGRRRSYVALNRRNAQKLAPKGPPSGKSHSGSLARLIQAHRDNPDLDIQVVPVSIFVGRAPDKASNWFSVLFSENWTIVGRFRRMMSILLNGRNTMVRFSQPLRVRDIVNEGLDEERTVRKLSRILRTHFHRVRAALIGPDMSTRRLLVDRVMGSEGVRKAIEDQARRDKSSPQDAWKKANAIAYEIAADYSHPVIRSISFLLTPVWNRIYRGVLVHHLDKVKSISPGNEIIYVPCHRSHMDYLLLSYLLYRNGIYPPHIVAGVNLNLPVVGTILRKGGAFFIRRSIRGSQLYSAVFSEYMAQLVSNGYSLEYFIEGGRSRTGRLLPPKGGTLAMTLRAYLRSPTRPVLVQPVYIGYEKLMEGNSYLDELSGKPKEKESIFQLISGIPKVLSSNYGQVVVNFGEPIALNDMLATYAPEWDGKPVEEDEKPQWLNITVDALADKIQENVNRAADVNPINLLSLALLSTPKHAMSETDLVNQINLYKTLLERLPYSSLVTVTPHSAAQIIEHGLDINVLERVTHPMGDVLQVEDDEKAVLLSYYRNNIVHLFTASSWIACCFLHNRRMHLESLIRRGRSVYPFLKNELFLPWTDDEFEKRLRDTVQVLIDEGLLQREAGTEDIIERNTGTTDEVFRLRAIGHSLQQAFERYYIAMSILAKNGSGTLTSGQLETMCQMAAQRLSLLYAPAAPEFFDKTLFRSFIQQLRELGLVTIDSEGKLAFDEKLQSWANDAKFILGRDLRHTIEKISPAVVEEVVQP